MKKSSFYSAVVGGLLVTASFIARPALLGAQPSNRITTSAREANTGRQSAGEVLVNGKVALRIRGAAGGLTPVQRADRVARRLDELSASNKLRPEELQIRTVPSGAALYSGKELIVTADRAQASANGVQPVRLAETWRDNLSTALAGRVVDYRQDRVREAAVEAEPELKTKLVPILTVGSSGSIGVAQVTGPEEYVRQVKAVAQLATDYKDRARIRMLVPIHTENIVQDLKRVPQVAVTGIGDIRL
jgi:hypothetical protein